MLVPQIRRHPDPMSWVPVAFLRRQCLRLHRVFSTSTATVKSEVPGGHQGPELLGSHFLHRVEFTGEDAFRTASAAKFYVAGRRTRGYSAKSPRKQETPNAVPLSTTRR